MRSKCAHSINNLEPPMRELLNSASVIALTLALSACSTPSAPLCQPLPANLRIRPQPLPAIQATGSISAPPETSPAK